LEGRRNHLKSGVLGARGGRWLGAAGTRGERGNRRKEQSGKKTTGEGKKKRHTPDLQSLREGERGEENRDWLLEPEIVGKQAEAWER